MATYKVIQDIEAEDKLVGPLTLRQFIYAGVAAVCLYICFLAYTRNAQFLIVIFLPIAGAAGFFGFPWKGEQPTEIWALARLRFAVKPRVRIWDQDGMKDLVTITVPKKLAPVRPAKLNLTQSEVQSRLKALADTIDSRGWATRNAAYGIQQNWAHPSLAPVPAAYAPTASMPSNDDMFDEQNAVAQNFDAMLAKSTQQKRQRVLQEMAQAQMPQPPQPQPQAQMPSYNYGLAQLPSPVMPASMQMQAPAMPMMQPTAIAPAQPAMPQAAAQAPQPAGAQQNNYWFANGPAYPANPSPAQQAQPHMPMPIPSGPMPTPPSAPVAMPAPHMPAPSPAPAAMPTPAPMPMPSPMQAPAPAPTAAIPEPDRTDGQAKPEADATPAPHPMPAPAHPAIPVPPAHKASPLPPQIALPMPGMPMPGNPGARPDSRIESDAPLVEAATPSAEEAEMGHSIKEKNDNAVAISYSHMRVLQPSGSEPLPATLDALIDASKAQYIEGQAAAAPPAQPVTRTPDPAILELANNDDLDIATIARQASKEIKKSPDEVEIQLH